MGCFNVASTCSGLSLGCNDDVLFFPLIPFSNYNKLEGGVMLPHTSYLVSNEGACIFYKPFCLPIKGKYNDYGGIEDIVEDENTAYLEEFFDMTIQEFIDGIQEGNLSHEDPEKDEILSSLSGMWENAVFYRNIINKYNNEFNLANKSDISLNNLKHLNFNIDKNKNTGDKRYHTYVSHPSYPDFFGHSDGTWTHFFHKGNTLKPVYNIKSLFQLIKSEGFDLKGIQNISDFDNLSVHELKLKLFVEKNKNLKISQSFNQNNTLEILNSFKDNIKDMSEKEIEVFKSKVFSAIELSNDRKLYNDNYYLRENKYLRYAANQNLYKQLADLMSFEQIMTSCNKIFMPTQNGEQEGNHQLHLEMTKETLKILNYKLKLGNF
tara:strand:+ start:13634 stop:14767 length:1134 start_codon:yes stop_codon:yes gene_type:complete